jgi:hypothetical protein
MEQEPEQTVTFFRLSDSVAGDPDTISIFDASEAKADFIREVIEVGLDSGNYKKLCSQIDSLFKSGYVTNQAHVLGNIIACLSEKANRIKLASMLLSCDDAIFKIQSSSYIHHSGFRKIVLLETKLFKLRLHVFEQIGNVIAQENIHDHRWPFASVCLQGDLVSRIFERFEFEKSRFYHYVYSPVGADNSYTVQGLGIESLRESSLLKIRKGMGYYLPVNMTHRVVNHSGERVITLVITGPPVKDTCNLYAEKEFEEEKNEVQRFEQTDIHTAIRELKFIEGYVYHH